MALMSRMASMNEQKKKKKKKKKKRMDIAYGHMDM